MARLFWLVGVVLLSAGARGDESLYRGVIDGRISMLITLDMTGAERRDTVVYDATGGDGLRLQGTTDYTSRTH